MNRKNNKRFIFYAILAVFLVVMAFNAIAPLRAQRYTYEDLCKDVIAGNIIEATVTESGKITVKTAQGVTKSFKFTSMSYQDFYDHYRDNIQAQIDAGTLKYNLEQPSGTAAWVNGID